jgi:hypothetical protein
MYSYFYTLQCFYIHIHVYIHIYTGDHGNRDSLNDMSNSNISDTSNDFFKNPKYNEDLNSEYNSQDDIHLSNDMGGKCLYICMNIYIYMHLFI